MAEGKEERKPFLRRHVKLVLSCEWGECSVTSHSAHAFVDHVKTHINEVASRVVNCEDRVDLVCQWCDCMHTIEGGLFEFKRHLFFHAFHSKLKSIGMNFIVKSKLGTCMLDAGGRNIIPDLPERFHCGWKDCEAVYDNPEHYYQHVRDHAEDYPIGRSVPGGCKCLWEGCEISSKSRYKLQDHLRSHTQEKVIACPTCGNLFSSSPKFKDHLLKQDNSLRSFQCSHCGKCFSHLRLLKDHMRKHVSNYKCPFCEMTVTAPSQLKTHIKYRHTDDKEFICKICDKGFKTERDIERHERSRHMTTAFFFCPNDDCDFKCKYQFQVSQHVKTVHEGQESRYACHICTCEYQRGRTLTIHLMKQHGFRWMPGHRKFRYKLGEDGKKRLQTVRYESYELSQQMQEEGYRRALSGLDAEVVKKLESARQRGEKIDHGRSPGDRTSPSENRGEEGQVSGSLGEDSVGGRQDEEEEQEEEEGVSHELAREMIPGGDGSDGRTNEEMYNLEMLGDVALHSSDDYAERKTAGKKDKGRARKSLEDTISALRNSPKKKPASASKASVRDSQGSSCNGTGNARHRKRKAASVKRASTKKKLKKENTSPEEDAETAEPVATVTNITNVSGHGLTRSETSKVECSQNWAQNEQGLSEAWFIQSPHELRPNQCQLVTEDGQVIVVETNMPSEIIGLSNMLDTGSDVDYGALPPGTDVIVCGSDDAEQEVHLADM